MSMLSTNELEKLSAAESLFPSPIPVQSVSSDEFMPGLQTKKQREFETRVKEMGARMAKRLGATHGINRLAEDWVDALYRITDDKGADHILEIAGGKSLGNSLLALTAVLAEWSSSASYADRISHLTGTSGGLNDGFFLNTSGPAATLQDDGAVDRLVGGAGLDWFIVSANDKIHGKAPKETVTTV